LKYFSPVFPSPILTATTSTSCFDEEKSFELDGNGSHSSDSSRRCSEFEMKIESDDSYERDVRLAKKVRSKQEIADEGNSPMTKSVGTKTFASPEQLSADLEKFDQRADIWSLGLIFLLLFHPMSTYMEQIQIINDAKNGKTPGELEKDSPGIAQIIKKMLSKDPNQRPGIKEILQHLKIPKSTSTKNYSGKVKVKKEDATEWKTKWIKIEEENVFYYETEYAKKAESVYNLSSQWTILLKEDDKLSRSESDESSGSDRSFDLDSTPSPDSVCTRVYIAFENPVQLGCILRGVNSSETLELYKKLVKMF